MKRCQKELNGGVIKKTRIEVDDEPNSPRTKSIYQKYFEFKYVNNIKYGCCITCGKNDKNEYKVTLKMTAHNTSSLRNHLKLTHLEIFKEMVQNAQTFNVNKDTRKQNLNTYFKVYIFT